MKLRPKQQAMIVERLKDKTAPNHEIIKRAGYKVSNNHAAAQIYLENMKKPEIAKKLEDVADEMEDTLITTVRRYRNSDSLEEVKEANLNARWIHDKVHGKATQRTENVSVSLSFGMDLTGTTQE